jgi:formamidopyrimidine-DNA glycosylase
MPELPEVETVVRALRKTILGQKITSVDIHKSDRIFPGRKKFASLLSGATFAGVRRRGKNILIDLSNDRTLWVHLKMTGHFYYLPSSEPVAKHDHLVFHLADNGNNLRFNDYRRFGRLRIFPTSDILEQKGLAELGPEPLDFSADDFVKLLKSRRRMIKPALLDQTFIVGLGNIYVDESLFRARIHPRRLTDSVSVPKLKELHGHIQDILKKAIRLMGTSVDTFAGLNGQPGRYQKYLLAYGREGEACGRCGGAIRREKIGSRSAHFCPRCQRSPRQQG